MIGANLKYLRLKNKFSQEYVATYLGKKSFTTVQKWESDVSDPPLAIVGKLAKLYNVSIDDLFYQDLTKPVLNQKSRISITNAEEELIKKYRQLPQAGKAAVDTMLNVQYDLVKPKLLEDTETS